MRTNIVLNDELVEKALFLVPAIKTKKDLIDTALREFIEVRQMKQIKDIRGLDLFADDYDYKKMREVK
ncbi:MAG: type II toxin-antitoxin system VapB family antitoxin [Treponema sp.]|nr:type II toxin-antitoxin system VapB family antitoxin [Treponema sp.]